MQTTKFTFAVITAMTALMLFASASRGADKLADSSHPPASGQDSVVFNPEGLVIDSIIIENLNIHEGLENGAGRTLFGLADKLRWVTRKHVVTRELLFNKGDRWSQAIVDETARNLRTRLAINDAWITALPSETGGLIVRVKTRDRWTLLGTVKVKRDGNETDFQVGVHEHNLFGRNHFLSVDYFVQDADDNYIRWSYANKRLRGERLRLELEYSNDPRDELKTVSISRPFYSLSQSLGLYGRVSTEGGRFDKYSDTLLIAQWQKNADIFEFGATYRWGGYFRKVNLGLGYRYLYRVASDTVTLLQDPGWDGFPEDSVTHQVVGTIALTDQQFIVERGIDGFYYAEDMTLEKSLTVQLGRAFQPGFSDHRYDLFTWRANFAHRFSGHIISIAYVRSFWFRSSQTIREQSQVSAMVYNRQLDFLTGILRARFVSETESVLNLGGKSGLRGFDTYYSSGNRALLVNLEARFFPGLELLSLLIGPVVFADIGRTWNVNEPFRISGFARSIGVGLRLSAEKHTRTQLIRIDLAYGQDNTWHLAFGSGQYF